MRTGKGMSLLLAAALGLLLVNQSPLMSQTADAGAPKRKGVHREAVVSIGQDAELKEGDSADQVVVIGGSAKIAGAVDQDVVIIGGCLLYTSHSTPSGITRCRWASWTSGCTAMI